MAVAAGVALDAVVDFDAAIHVAMTVSEDVLRKGLFP
jgi:hypothetical protein